MNTPDATDMPESPDTPLSRFLYAFQRAGAGPSAASAAFFADTFLAVGPGGAQAVPAAAFLPVLDKRKELFESLGSSPAALVSVDEIPLDARYSVARTRWRLSFQRHGQYAGDIDVQSTYLIDLEAEHILVYIAHQDIFAILRERGILAS